jgi:type II restriction enzyme
MQLSMAAEMAVLYKSGSQKARVVTEAWGENNFYCPCCSSPKVNRLKHNSKAIDYACPLCEAEYQLKSQKSRIGKTVNDGEHRTMMDKIRAGEPPHFYFLHYDLATWKVRSLLLIPGFAFPPSAIIKRNPTLPKGRSKPWVGCNIALSLIPTESRIVIVNEGDVMPAVEVRKRFNHVKPLKEIPLNKRGWMLDILNIVHRLGKLEFTNQDVYAFERELEELHPGNRHIRDKIRQQLQNLAKAGLLIHAGRNDYRLK